MAFWCNLRLNFIEKTHDNNYKWLNISHQVEKWVSGRGAATPLPPPFLPLTVYSSVIKTVLNGEQDQEGHSSTEM